MLVILLTGFCLSGAQTGLNAYAPGCYPTMARATGVSWMLGVGRLGSILGSSIGGLLLNDRIVTTVVHLALGEPTLPWPYWWAPVLGMLFWPPLFVLMDALRLGRRKRG